MKDPIEKFVEGADFVGIGKSLDWDGYGNAWHVKYEIYRSGDRIVRLRRRPIYRHQTFWECFAARPKEKIGDDYETRAITKDEAFDMLIEAGMPLQKATELLNGKEPE